MTEKDFLKAINDCNESYAIGVHFLDDEKAASACYQLAIRMAEEEAVRFAEWMIQRRKDNKKSKFATYTDGLKTTSQLFKMYKAQNP